MEFPKVLLGVFALVYGTTPVFAHSSADHRHGEDGVSESTELSVNRTRPRAPEPFCVYSASECKNSCGRNFQILESSDACRYENFLTVVCLCATTKISQNEVGDAVVFSPGGEHRLPHAEQNYPGETREARARSENRRRITPSGEHILPHAEQNYPGETRESRARRRR